MHLKLLQLYINLGLKLQKVHRALSFTQKPWLASYIDLNTQRRAKSKSNFEKDFYKLMNNSVYGKTCENLRKPIDVKIVKDSPKKLRLLHRPNCMGFTIFDNSLIAINLSKFTFEINKPTYVGFCVLELSKHLMYDFLYNFIRRKYGPKAKLLFTDTDSLMYEIETGDIYHDLTENRTLFDFGSNPRDSPFYDDTNKKVIGKIKA